MRRFCPEDRETYLTLAKEFYASPAVLHAVPETHFSAAFDELMADSPYLDGWLLTVSETDERIAGYALVFYYFSQEAGGLAAWLDELYVRPAYQGLGLGSRFLRYLNDDLPAGVKAIRLEVEPDNVRAAALYRRNGFSPLGYAQMLHDRS